MFVELGANAVTSLSVAAMRCFSFIFCLRGKDGCMLFAEWPLLSLFCPCTLLCSFLYLLVLSLVLFSISLTDAFSCRVQIRSAFFSWCFLPMRVWLTALLWQKQFCCFFFLTPFTCLRHLVSFSSHGLLSKGIVALSNTYVLTASSFCYFTKELYGSMSHHGNKWVLLPPSRGSSSVCLFHL